MKVIAAEGTQCPKEGKPREYITDAEAVEVPDNSSYYRRLIKDGSLIISLQAVKPASKKEKTGGKE